MAEKDRRFRKSESALLNAFVSLRPQGPVSVSDIIREADVSKATFYLHYASVRELANAALDLLISKLVMSMGGQECVERLITGISQESRLCKAVLQENSSSLSEAILLAFPFVFEPYLGAGLSASEGKRQARCLAYALVGYLQGAYSTRQKPTFEGWVRTMSGLRL